MQQIFQEWMPIITIPILLILFMQCVVSMYLLKRVEVQEKLLKIALGEVDIKVNMGDYIKKNKKQILDANNFNLYPPELLRKEHES